MHTHTYTHTLICTLTYIYCIRQNSRGGKLSWFFLNRESFPVEYFTALGIHYLQEASIMKVFPLNFHFCSNRESFPPRMFCCIRYNDFAIMKLEYSLYISSNYSIIT